MAIKVNLPLFSKFIGMRQKSISDAEIAPILRGAAIVAYKTALRNVPQYSGYMASNLTIYAEGFNPRSTDMFWNDNWHNVKTIYKAGSPEAMAKADNRNQGFNGAQLTIESKVTIGYAGDKGYFETVEAGGGTFRDLRDVNRPSMALVTGAAKTMGIASSPWQRMMLKKERI